MKTKSWIIATVLVAITIAALWFGLRENSGSNPTNRVVVVLPLTGPVAIWGEHFKRGADMFRRDYPTSPLKLEILDSQSSPATAVTVVQQALVKGKPYAIV